jgi:hypothetical protein
MAPAAPKKRLNQPDREYPHELYEPIVEGPSNFLALYRMSIEEREKYEEARGKLIWYSRSMKLLLLMQHYGVEHSDQRRWRDLALRLAYDLFPGFSVMDSPPRGRGRPMGRTKHDNFRLASDIEALACDEGVSAGEACRRLVKRKGVWKGEDSKRLIECYRRHCGRLKTTPKERIRHKRYEEIAQALLRDPAPPLCTDNGEE